MCARQDAAADRGRLYLVKPVCGRFQVMTIPIPRDEEERLVDLRSLDLLDTPTDERFDRITRIAQRCFGVPIALVSLIDKDRQWFKSRIGLDLQETPREVSFCAHAILGDDILHVADASADQRFKNNPLVTGDPGIRFYAGAPIDSPSGHKLGSLCILDKSRRDLGDQDLALLRDLADLVEDEIATLQLAATDELTHLNNRRGLLLTARQLLSYAKRLGEPASLVFIDLDGLERINKELGEAAGDEALVETARLLHDTLRECDVIARLGGDEFCVFFTGVSALGAGQAMTRLQRAVKQRNGRSPGKPRLSLSIGLANWDPDSGESLDELIRRVDRKMYALRKSRRH
jgi:diguanylate cyclase (GGDEF)-like protein